jgi:hypothetical protein
MRTRRRHSAVHRQRWSVDETYTKIAGKPAYVYRAIDGRGQSGRRLREHAARDRRRDHVLPPRHRGHGRQPGRGDHRRGGRLPAALAAALPPVAHETGRRIQQRIERDHSAPQGTITPHRGFKTLAGARVLCGGTPSCALRGGFYDWGTSSTPWRSRAAVVVQAWPP